MSDAPIEHGNPSRYRYHGCRCEPCTSAASRQTVAAARRRREAAGPTDAEADAIRGLPGETWRAVNEFTDYEVSNLGRVRSLKFTYPRLLTALPNRDGYLRVRLYANNRPRYKFVAGLVAEAFIGPRPEGQEVRHYNDDKSNNAVDNLLYGTRSQNILDAVRNGTQAQVAKTHCPQGHPYDAANTYVRPQGWRACRACQSARQRTAA